MVLLVKHHAISHLLDVGIPDIFGTPCFFMKHNSESCFIVSHFTMFPFCCVLSRILSSLIDSTEKTHSVQWSLNYALRASKKYGSFTRIFGASVRSCAKKKGFSLITVLLCLFPCLRYYCCYFEIYILCLR